MCHKFNLYKKLNVSGFVLLLLDIKIFKNFGLLHARANTRAGTNLLSGGKSKLIPRGWKVISWKMSAISFSPLFVSTAYLNIMKLCIIHRVAIRVEVHDWKIGCILGKASEVVAKALPQKAQRRQEMQCKRKKDRRVKDSLMVVELYGPCGVVACKMLRHARQSACEQTGMNLSRLSSRM